MLFGIDSKRYEISVIDVKPQDYTDFHEKSFFKERKALQFNEYGKCKMQKVFKYQQVNYLHGKNTKLDRTAAAAEAK